MEMNKYAAVRLGYAISGVGDTPESAREDARARGNRETDLDEIKEYANARDVRANNGGLVILPCSDKLANFLNEHGATTYTETDDGICLPVEANENNIQDQDASDLFRMLDGIVDSDDPDTTLRDEDTLMRYAEFGMDMNINFEDAKRVMTVGKKWLDDIKYGNGDWSGMRSEAMDALK